MSTRLWAAFALLAGTAAAGDTHVSLSSMAPACPLPQPTVVTVNPAGGADHTSIRDALAAVTGSAAAPVTIFLQPGIYNELNLTLKHHVDIEGASRDHVVIISDGLRTDVDPGTGTRYCEQDFSAKHGFLTPPTSGGPVTISNLTIRVSDVKYTIHMTAAASDITVRNCLLQHSTGAPVGVGLVGPQVVRLEGCTLEKLGAHDSNVMGAASYGLTGKNGDGRRYPVRLEVVRCHFVNLGMLRYQDWVTTHNQGSLIVLDSCTTDDLVNPTIFWRKHTTACYCTSLLLIHTPMTVPILVDPADFPDFHEHVWVE